MKNAEFNPEQKHQEWANRPSRAKTKKKRRISAILLLLNIVVIAMAYVIMTRHQAQSPYYSTRTETDGIEYRLSIADNYETRMYQVTLTIRNMKGGRKMIYPEKDTGLINFNFRDETITSLMIDGLDKSIELTEKPVIYMTRIDKAIIDEYMRSRSFGPDGKKNLFNFKKNIYSIEAVLDIKKPVGPLKLTIRHEAAK